MFLAAQTERTMGSEHFRIQCVLYMNLRSYSQERPTPGGVMRCTDLTKDKSHEEAEPDWVNTSINPLLTH